MRVINEKGIPFGLMPNEEQTELEEAHLNGGEAYYYTGEKWVRERAPDWLNHTSYKVELPELEGLALWTTLPDWNGDYAPSVPESFEAWAVGKKIMVEGVKPVPEEFVRWKSKTRGVFYDADGMSRTTRASRWCEYKESEPTPTPDINEQFYEMGRKAGKLDATLELVKLLRLDSEQMGLVIKRLEDDK